MSEFAGKNALERLQELETQNALLLAEITRQTERYVALERRVLALEEGTPKPMDWDALKAMFAPSDTEVNSNGLWAYAHGIQKHEQVRVQKMSEIDTHAYVYLDFPDGSLGPVRMNAKGLRELVGAAIRVLERMEGADG